MREKINLLILFDEYATEKKSSLQSTPYDDPPPY